MYSESVTCEPFDSFIFTPCMQMQQIVGTDVEDLSMRLILPLHLMHTVVCIEQLFVLIAREFYTVLLASPNHHFIP